MVTSTVLFHFTAMPDLISLVHKSPMGLNRLNSTFRIHWATKLSSATNNAGSQQASPGLGRLDVSRTPDSNLVEEASGISKRQLTMKITGMAAKEQRPPSNKSLWYVHDSVFKQYNVDPQRVAPLAPLQPERPPAVMSPDDPQIGKRPIKRVMIGTPTIRDLWSKPYPHRHHTGGKMGSPALDREGDTPLSKRPRPDEGEVIMIDTEPSGGQQSRPQQDDVVTCFVRGGVASDSACAPAVLKQAGVSQEVEPVVAAVSLSKALKPAERREEGREEMEVALMVGSCAVKETFIPVEGEPT